jgi:DNA gyrase subunit A
VLSSESVSAVSDEPKFEDYPCFMFVSKEGYFKKCLPASLRGSDVQKFKEGDELLISTETTNGSEVLFFTNHAQVYKAHMYDFDDIKASALGEYVPAKLGFDEGEKVVAAHAMSDFSGSFVVFYENGKAVRFPAEAYKTVTNRKKLTNALASGTVAVGVFRGGNEKQEYLIISSASRALLIKEKQITEKSTRSASGATVMTLKKGHTVVSASVYDPDVRALEKESRYRKSTLPSTGGLFEDDDPELNQMTLI